MLELENPELDQQNFLDTFRAFDNTGKGYIQSSLIREILCDVMGQREKDREHVFNVFQLNRDRKVSFEGTVGTLLNLDQYIQLVIQHFVQHFMQHFIQYFIEQFI